MAEAGDRPTDTGEGEQRQEMEVDEIRSRIQQSIDRNGQNGSVMSALSRGLATLAESEGEQDMEEIKKLDIQLDTLNAYMGKMEEKVKENNTKMVDMLESQKQARQERKSSLSQRLQANQAEDSDFAAQVSEMLNRCQQTRKVSAPASMMSDEQRDTLMDTTNS